MSLYITGFIVAVVLAVLVLIWIAYCMFIRERHKSEYYQYNISDLKHRSNILNQNDEDEDVAPPIKKEMAVGMFVLPSKHKQKDENFVKRPDYPESPVHFVQPRTEKLIDMLDVDMHYKDGIYEVDSGPKHHSQGDCSPADYTDV